jgi:hypothetical protein
MRFAISTVILVFSLGASFADDRCEIAPDKKTLLIFASANADATKTCTFICEAVGQGTALTIGCKTDGASMQADGSLCAQKSVAELTEVKTQKLECQQK